MTVEHKLVVGLDDIRGLVFECRNEEASLHEPGQSLSRSQ